MSSTTRMCCGCRKRFTPTHLFRLQINPATQQLMVVPSAKKIKGRSAWVCWDVSCIRAVIKHPKKLQQSLRRSTQTNHLSKQIYEELSRRYKHILGTMMQDGVVSIHDTQPPTNAVSIKVPTFTSTKISQVSIDANISTSQDRTYQPQQYQWIVFTSSHYQQSNLHQTLRLLEQIKNC